LDATNLAKRILRSKLDNRDINSEAA